MKVYFNLLKYCRARKLETRIVTIGGGVTGRMRTDSQFEAKHPDIAKRYSFEYSHFLGWDKKNYPKWRNWEKFNPGNFPLIALTYLHDNNALFA